jgi:S-methylmethionine-dependent homocysteine/selenocysteine methylase
VVVKNGEEHSALGKVHVNFSDAEAELEQLASFQAVISKPRSKVQTTKRKKLEAAKAKLKVIKLNELIKESEEYGFLIGN